MLQALHDITLEMGAEPQLPGLLKSIMDHAQSLLDADRGGGIYLVDSGKIAIRLAYGAGINRGREGAIVQIDQGVAGHVFRTAQPLVVEDYTHWEERVNLLVPDPPSTVMGVPLLLDGQVIGMLLLVANSHRRKFNQQDLQQAEMFAAQAAIAIRNAQLYQQAQQDITERKRAEIGLQRVNRLYATLSQINQMIVRHRQQDALFRAICQVAIDHGQFRMAWIGLVDEASQRINPVVFAGEEQGYLVDIHIVSLTSRWGTAPPAQRYVKAGASFRRISPNDPRMGRGAKRRCAATRSSAAVPLRQNSPSPAP